MHVGGFPGASRPFQGTPGASRGLQGAPGASRRDKDCFERKMRGELKFHAEWSGWTRPPTMAGGLNALRLGLGKHRAVFSLPGLPGLLFGDS